MDCKQDCNYKYKFFHRMIIACWLVMLFCIILKLFFGNYFEIICTNKRFCFICDYCDNNIWAKFLISFIYSIISEYLFVCAIMGTYKFNRLQTIIVFLTVIIGTIIKIISSQFGLIFDLWQVVVLPCVFTLSNTKRHKFVLLANALLILFQFISMFVKNLGIKFVTNNGILISSIYSIDVLLMLAIYFGYSNIKNYKGGKIK